MKLKTMDFAPRRRWLEQIADVNRELWLLLSLFVIAGLLNWLVAAHGMVLGLYTLPTLFSAYVYGRRHAVMTSVGSILLVIVVNMASPSVLVRPLEGDLDRWFDIGVWSGLLVITAYGMGTMYERKESHLRELRRTYFGVLAILQQVVSNDKQVHNHSYRVASYAGSIARHAGLDEQTTDDIRAAALLHDIGKLESSCEILCRATSLTPTETAEFPGDHQSASVGAAKMGSLHRIIPIILAQHDHQNKAEGNAVFATTEMTLEGAVLSLADAYDTLTSDRPYRRAITPFEAKQIISAGSGTDFDPRVVDAFQRAFDRREMEIPDHVIA
jgi:putative nucleotidyltransferase with HDIG domain